MSEWCLLPSKVSLVQFVSSFCGHTLHTIWSCVTSFHLSGGTSSSFMKKMVLVQSTLPRIPCAGPPTSLPKEDPHLFLYFGRLMRCQYLSNSPVSTSKPAKLVRNLSGYCLRDACRFDGALPESLTALMRRCTAHALRLRYILGLCQHNVTFDHVWPFFDFGVPVLYILTLSLLIMCRTYIFWLNPVSVHGWI